LWAYGGESAHWVTTQSSGCLDGYLRSIQGDGRLQGAMKAMVAMPMDYGKLLGDRKDAGFKNCCKASEKWSHSTRSRSLRHAFRV